MTESPSGTDQAGLVSHWKSLKTQAENGELRMDPEIGNALKARADAMITALDDMLDDAAALEHVSGFGSLGSAVELQKKFAAKAVTDQDSAVNRLKESHEIVTLMSETYALAIRRIEETDQSTAGALGKTGAQ
ncbi:hypothetical protein IU421_15385 [Nocardia cyriacigeorgica]|uniref:hypothetical protein n=1 Tax=Nocardia cyriacigeorgica TaxID=135487 RepID=UPI0018940F63|nr:hypothetical protein [Nocardia cyriacigeorgica]MBF6158214.1 hypothetical protein [Nocardia cyriacigeorgica]MBF6197185.1 hypothetical protein [Nocardia cyriacigeorgica]MBF6344730.1 hypothetical protein [Nocardia cyriacigeorgica]MBF6515652.1 hypothetical protein [Nocardia cyriacigeorgica]